MGGVVRTGTVTKTRRSALAFIPRVSPLQRANATHGGFFRTFASKRRPWHGVLAFIGYRLSHLVVRWRSTSGRAKIASRAPRNLRPRISCVVAFRD